MDGNCRTLFDVYQLLKEVSPIKGLADGLGITRAGVRAKCLYSQFFREPEKELAITALKKQADLITAAIIAIENLPTKV
jgi:hypothetical protein